LATDLTTGLARHRVTPTAKAREEVVELRELDLRLSLSRLGVLGKNIEDYRGAINDFDFDGILERAALARGEFSVGNHSVSTNGHDNFVEFLDFSAPEIGSRVGMRFSLKHTVKDNCTRGLAQCGEFLHRVLGVFLVSLGIDPNEDDVLDSKLAVFDLGDVLELGSKSVDAPEGDAVCEVHFANGGRINLFKFVCHVVSGYGTACGVAI
jgi:hypothetical protein